MHTHTPLHPPPPSPTAPDNAQELAAVRGAGPARAASHGMRPSQAPGGAVTPPPFTTTLAPVHARVHSSPEPSPRPARPSPPTYSNRWVSAGTHGCLIPTLAYAAYAAPQWKHVARRHRAAVATTALTPHARHSPLASRHCCAGRHLRRRSRARPSSLANRHRPRARPPSLASCHCCRRHRYCTRSSSLASRRRRRCYRPHTRHSPLASRPRRRHRHACHSSPTSRHRRAGLPPQPLPPPSLPPPSLPPQLPPAAVSLPCRIRERYRALRYYLKLYTWG